MTTAEPISRADAEQVAQELIDLFGVFTHMLKPGASPSSIVELVRRIFEDPEGLKRDLADEIMSDRTSPAEFLATRRQIAAMLASPRRMLDEIRKDLPSGQSGRPAVVVTDIQLVQAANRFLPICRALLRLRAHPTKQPLAASVEYLAPDFLDVAATIAAHIESIERILGNRQMMKRARSVEGKARVLAYTLAGEECGYSGTYALRKVRSAIYRQKQAGA